MTIAEVIIAAGECYDDGTTVQIKVSRDMLDWLRTVHPGGEPSEQPMLWGIPVFIDPDLTGRTLTALDRHDNVVKTIVSRA